MSPHILPKLPKKPITQHYSNQYHGVDILLFCLLGLYTVFAIVFLLQLVWCTWNKPSIEKCYSYYKRKNEQNQIAIV